MDFETYFSNLLQRVRGLILRPWEEVTSGDSGRFYSFREIIRENFLVLIWLQPVGKCIDVLIWYDRSIMFSRDVVKPLVFNMVLLAFIWFMGQLVSAFGSRFGVSRQPVEYTGYLAAALVPYMTLGIFQFLPVIGSYMAYLGFIYALVIIWLVWHRVYRLNFSSQILFALMQILFLTLAALVLGLVLFVVRYAA